MSIDAKGHHRRHGRSRKLKNIKTGGVPLPQLKFDLAAETAVRWRHPTAADKARIRQHAERERAEQLEAMRRERPEFLLCLAAAVPMWIERLMHQPLSYIEARATGLAYAASEWDVLEREGKPGQAARAFNAIAEGLAALSFGPGGVTWLGLHFEAVHPESPRASGQQEAV